jgi:hypothetical protein
VKRLIGALCLVVVAAGCVPEATRSTAAPPDPTTPAPSESAPPTPEPEEQQPTPPGQDNGCPTGGGGGLAGMVSYRQAAPSTTWKDRPVVRLCFDVPADRREVTGHETVTFKPDKQTCELVFRAWPNKPDSTSFGTKLEVTTVVLGGKPVTPKVEAAGAPKGTPGTLIRVPVAGCLKPGQSVTADLDFKLTLGPDGDERASYSSEDKTAWLATAFPLLAWERGRGWATEPAVNLFGEMTTSEEFDLESLLVIAPSSDEVLGTGRSDGTVDGPREGTTAHRFSADAVRDVAVTVGELTVVQRDLGSLRVHVGAPASGTKVSPDVWADETVSTIRSLVSYLGDFPYQDLWVTIAPDVSSGIELAGAIQYGDLDPRQYRALVPHEVAHMWFYGLVGNDQARDPWLDEAFAEYAETLVNGTAEESAASVAPAPVRNQVGRPMSWYAALPGAADLYSAGVYRQGGAMLHKAREAVGADEFDELLRTYISTNAHRIATPASVRSAFASAPEALAIFREYGALPR